MIFQEQVLQNFYIAKKIATKNEYLGQFFGLKDPGLFFKCESIYRNFSARMVVVIHML